ncbi:MAG: hypothetical protein LIO81_08225 [Clostridiales bacterium]|nr:hypothetical protein [Clostridiales bacterium]
MKKNKLRTALAAAMMSACLAGTAQAAVVPVALNGDCGSASCGSCDSTYAGNSCGSVLSGSCGSVQSGDCSSLPDILSCLLSGQGCGSDFSCGSGFGCGSGSGCY